MSRIYMSRSHLNLSLAWTLSNPILCMDSEVILDIIAKFLEFPSPFLKAQENKEFYLLYS